MSRFVPAAVGALALAIIAFFALVIAVIPSTILGSEPSTYLGPTSANRRGERHHQGRRERKGYRRRPPGCGRDPKRPSLPRAGRLHGHRGQLVAGDYEFDKGMVTLTVIDRIHNGITAPVMVTIPEGLRIEEVGALLEKKGVVSASDFVTAAKKTDYDSPSSRGFRTAASRATSSRRPTASRAA